MRTQFQQDAPQALPPMLQYLLFMLGLLLALPISALVALTLKLPITASGIGYLAGSVLGVAGLILAPWARWHSRTLTITGVIVTILVSTMRLMLAWQDTTPSISMIILPQGKEASGVGSLIDEQDSLIFGEAFFHFISGDSPAEHEYLTSALLADYSEMRA